jgi:NADH-quinone oxidoreductase subunit G
MKAYSSVSGKLHHSGSLDAIKQADGIIIVGSRVATDNPGVRYAMTTASRHNGAKIVYAHPIEDALMQNVVTQFMKYEAGSEEGVMALLANTLLQNVELSQAEKKFFDDLDLGYLEAESNVGEDELQNITKTFARTEKRVLIIGSDVFAHSRAAQIAKLAAMIEKYSDFSLVIIPENVNTAGVSLLCDLDCDENSSNVVGYNAEGTFTIGSLENCDLATPSLNQQEGTVVSIDNCVLPLNVAVAFRGTNLNEIANALGVVKENTIDYTQELPSQSGFKAIAFDSLENYLDKYGNDVRGYILDEVISQADGSLEAVADLAEYNGTVIYHSNPVLQFNAYTNSTKLLERDRTLRGSAQFSAAARIADGDEVEISFGSSTIKRVFKLDPELKGTVALNPTFDMNVAANEYKFLKSKIVRTI